MHCLSSIRTKWRWITVVGGALAVVGAAWWFTHRGLASESAYYAFEQAVEQHDASAIYAMVLDVEKAKHGITLQHVERALDRIYYTRAPRVRRCGFLIARGEVADRWHRYYPLWCDAATGKKLRSRHPSGTLFTGVDFFRMRSGEWRLSYTQWVGAYVMSNVIGPELKALGPSAAAADREAILKQRSSLLDEFGAAWQDPDIRTPPMTRKAGRMVLLAAPGEPVIRP